MSISIKTNPSFNSKLQVKKTILKKRGLFVEEFHVIGAGGIGLAIATSLYKAGKRFFSSKITQRKSHSAKPMAPWLTINLSLSTSKRLKTGPPALMYSIFFVLNATTMMKY